MKWEFTELAHPAFTSLMRRLSSAGFKREFAHVAVLPDWWAPGCEDDPSLLPDVEIRVARFVGAPLAVVRDTSAPLEAPKYQNAQLRRVRDINRDRLGPAIHAALQVGSAAIRNLTAPALRIPPQDPLAWRRDITTAGPLLQLADVVADLWKRGIPVLHAETLPNPSFQGLVADVEGRPIIVLGHDQDEPARLAFIIAHEVAHIVFGDCAPGSPVVDEQEEVSDDHVIEARADQYASTVMTGGVAIPHVQASGFKDLAMKASAVEKAQRIDASSVVWAWARRTGDYAMATMAAQALYRTKGGKRALRALFDQYVDLENASDSDRALLRCLHGDPQRDAVAS